MSKRIIRLYFRPLTTAMDAACSPYYRVSHSVELSQNYWLRFSSVLGCTSANREMPAFRMLKYDTIVLHLRSPVITLRYLAIELHNMKPRATLTLRGCILP